MSADLLRTALDADDSRQALAAARALAGLVGDQLDIVLVALAAELASPSPARQRRAALVGGVLGRIGSPLVVPLRQLLARPRWPVREAVLQSLARIDAGDEATRSAAASCAVLDRSAAVRLAALNLLALSEEGVPPAIRDTLNHRHPRVRCRALRAVARLDPADHIASLTDALTHSHRRVRRTAAHLLGDLGLLALSALGRLARCRCDGDVAVADAARDAFVKLQPHLPAALQPLCGSQNDPIALLAEFPAAVRDTAEVTRQRRRAALAGRGASLDPRAEARWLVGWVVEEITRAQRDNP